MTQTVTRVAPASTPERPSAVPISDVTGRAKPIDMPQSPRAMPPQPVQILLPPRMIEAQRQFDRMALVGGGKLAEHHHRRIARQQLHDAEHRERNDQQYQQDRTETAQQPGSAHAVR